MKEMKDQIKIKFPEGFEVDKFYRGPSVEDGDMVLEYCMDCTKKPNCEDNKSLGFAMGNNAPYWSDNFIAVKVETSYRFFGDSVTMQMCVNYGSPQLNLFKINPEYPMGLRKLIELAEKEKKKYLEENS